MIVQEFSFGNFKSFKDIQTLNLLAAKLKSKNKEIDQTNVHDFNGKTPILKTKAIYGANASGKSNVFKALGSFLSIAINSFSDNAILQKTIQSYQLSSETENEPTYFQLIFWENDLKYRYGFEANHEQITSEWLFVNSNKREQTYFIREEQSLKEYDATNFKELKKAIALAGENSIDISFCRKNALLITTMASFGFSIQSKQIIDSLIKIDLVNGLGNSFQLNSNKLHLQDKNTKKFMLDFLKIGDTGIEQICVVDSSNQEWRDVSKQNKKYELTDNPDFVKLHSKRKAYDSKLNQIQDKTFDFVEHESEGTIKLFELSSFIYRAISEGRPLFIDEFDARFHPVLTKKIVDLFNSELNTSAQLIIITHDTNLLSSTNLRRDQIEFVEKDRYGASNIYSLAEFTGIRNDASLEKNYLKGKYGAIPFLGDFNLLFKTKDAK